MRDLQHYSHILKTWKSKYSGTKPDLDLVSAAHALGCRPGIQAMSIAMALRPEGYTDPQYFVATGAASTAHNKLQQLESRGFVTVERRSGRPMTYYARLTSLGQERTKQYRMSLELHAA